MGLVQPWGAINPITELQARWVVRVFNQKSVLPSRMEMDQDIDLNAHLMAERYVASPRHTVQADYVEYCNEIADQIGCRPHTCEYLCGYSLENGDDVDDFLLTYSVRYLLTDFPLGRSLFFQGSTPYRYRLEGPNAWQGARQAILTQFQR